MQDSKIKNKIKQTNPTDNRMAGKYAVSRNDARCLPVGPAWDQ